MSDCAFGGASPAADHSIADLEATVAYLSRAERIARLRARLGA